MRDNNQDQDHRLALEIAQQPGYRVVLLCRDPHKADKAVSEIIGRSGNQRVSFDIVDVSSKESSCNSQPMFWATSG